MGGKEVYIYNIRSKSKNLKKFEQLFAEYLAS